MVPAQPQLFFLEQRILEFFAQHPVSSPDTPWLLAVSGGADSMAMLSALARLHQQHRLPCSQLIIGHLNHALRTTASDDADFVRQFTQHLKLTCHIETRDIPKIARQQQISTETAARQSRYEFLDETARRFNCSAVLVAHNADDQAETILHRILRGTGIRGLCGMAPIRPLTPSSSVTLARPLLNCTRTQIIDYLNQISQSWREDQTNTDPAYTRNRIRHQLIPLLRDQFNPQINPALLRLSKIASFDHQIIQESIQPLLNRVVIKQNDHCLLFDLSTLAPLSPAWQHHLIRQAIENTQWPLAHIGFQTIQTICSLIDKQHAGQTELPTGLIAERYDNQLAIRRLVSHLSVAFSPVPLAPNAQTAIPNGLIWYNPVRHEHGPVHMISRSCLPQTPPSFDSLYTHKPPTSEFMDADFLSAPITIRSRRPGDMFWPLGAPGLKNLADVMINLKIPASYRDQIALICKNQTILWIAGARLSNFAKTLPSTKKIENFIIS